MKYLQILNKKVIQRTAGIPYLVRWTILGIGKDSCFFSIKLHNILISDDACIHDHPWSFVSIILKGGYKETADIRYTSPTNGWGNVRFCEKSNLTVTDKTFGPGSILFRPARWSHQLEIDPKNPAWTLVFTFRKVKSWGFHTTKGWKIWYTYSKTKDC